MKKLLFRYLLINYLTFFIIALLSTSIVIWVFQAVNFLDIMIEDGRGYITYVKYSLLNLPKILSKLLPFVLFFSLFYVTIKYELNNELLIFWNFGVNKIQIIKFIFKFSILIFLIQIILTSIIIPYSQSLARSSLKNSTVNYYGNFIKPKKFNANIKNLTIYSEKKDSNGNLYNLYLKQDINENEFQIIYAKKGSFINIKSLPFLILYEGEQLISKNNNITNINFSKSNFPLQNLETNTTTYKKTQELGSFALFKCSKEIFYLKKNLIKEIENCSIENLRNIYREIYKRFIIPIYIPLLSIIPFLLFIYSKENNRYSKLRVFTFLFGLFTIIISETSIRLVSQNMLKNFILLIIPIFLIFILYVIFNKKFNLKFY